MPNINLREATKVNWHLNQETGNYPGDTNIQLGCLMRIADATEKMALNYVQMERELEWYSKKYEQQRIELDLMARKIAGLKGQITRMKKLKK